jgi:hypothetical protein
MTILSTKPATAETVNGLQGTDRLGRLIDPVAKPNSRSKQAYRLVRAHWVVVCQGNGRRRSIPVFIRRPFAILKAAEESERKTLRQFVRDGRL